MIYEHARLCLLGGFHLLVGHRYVTLSLQSRRLLALLAVCGPEKSRSCLAGTLWPDSSQSRAQANLRNALWRIQEASRALVATSRQSVSLREQVELDLNEARVRAQALSVPVESGSAAAVPGPNCPTHQTVSLLDLDVLPSWDEPWLAIERERHRQLRLHALEALSVSLCQLGRFEEAIDSALAAVRAEPLRESAQRALISAHLLEGNVVEAVRQLDGYCQLLTEELGIGPSQQLLDLVRRPRSPGLRPLWPTAAAV